MRPYKIGYKFCVQPDFFTFIIDLVALNEDKVGAFVRRAFDNEHFLLGFNGFNSFNTFQIDNQVF